jgi:hypothetical protein
VTNHLLLRSQRRKKKKRHFTHQQLIMSNAPSAAELRQISEQAERDLNSHQAKTGDKKTSPSDEAGVDSRVENKFPGAKVLYDEELSTNRGYNRRIPESEGGERDARGR